MKIRIDIERLLRWTIMEEMPKGKAVSTAPWDTISRIGDLGVRVQTSNVGGGDGLGFVNGEPHADAIIVAKAVRGLPRDFTFGAERCADLLGIYAACDPMSIRALALAPFNLSSLVMRCAILNERMPWECGVPQLRPVLYNSERGGRPHPMILGLDDDGITLIGIKADKHGRWPLHREPRAHVQFEEPSLAQLLEARAEYAAWHHALMTLARGLAGKLSDYDVQRPICAAEPWRTGETDRGDVHVIGNDWPMSKLPLGPRRKVAGPPLESEIERETRLSREARARDRRRAARPKKPVERGYSGI